MVTSILLTLFLFGTLMVNSRQNKLFFATGIEIISFVFGLSFFIGAYMWDLNFGSMLLQYSLIIAGIPGLLMRLIGMRIIRKRMGYSCRACVTCMISEFLLFMQLSLIMTVILIVIVLFVSSNPILWAVVGISSLSFVFAGYLYYWLSMMKYNKEEDEIA